MNIRSPPVNSLLGYNCNSPKEVPLLTWKIVLLAALSVSIGWGIRGQFGHEFGAALAGAIAGMVVALSSGRADWRRRIHYFSALGAVGFGFGGLMAYMKTVSYTQSSDSMTLLYGYFVVFVTGFAWAAPCGTGLALPAFLNRDELTKMFGPLCGVFVAWYLQDVGRAYYRATADASAGFYGSYGMSAILAALVVLIFVAISRKYWSPGNALIVYMSAGWWVGHWIFVSLCHFVLSPPSGDTWANVVGLSIGTLVWAWRYQMGGVGFATLSSGLLGGIGFSLGALVKVIIMKIGTQTNWHSIMEQTQGFFFGIALIITMMLLARRAPALSDAPPLRRWTEVTSVTFVLCGLLYANFRRSPTEWLREIEGFTPKLYDIPVVTMLIPTRGFIGWLDFVFLAITAMTIILLVRHLRHPLEFIPSSWRGKGQIFYLVFLWAIVNMNFTHVLPRWTAMRLITELTIIVNGILCTLLVVFSAPPDREPPQTDAPYGAWLRNIMVVGVVGTAIVCFTGWGTTRALWKGQPAGVVNHDQIRFGPNNTNTIK